MTKTYHIGPLFWTHYVKKRKTKCRACSFLILEENESPKQLEIIIHVFSGWFSVIFQPRTTIFANVTFQDRKDNKAKCVFYSAPSLDVNGHTWATSPGSAGKRWIRGAHVTYAREAHSQLPPRFSLSVYFLDDYMLGKSQNIIWRLGIST